MQLLQIFSGRNRHMPENFWPGSGCSKKIPGLNTIKIIFSRPGFAGKISRNAAAHFRIVGTLNPQLPERDLQEGEAGLVMVGAANSCSRRHLPSFIKGQNGGDCKSPEIVLRRRNPMTKSRKNSAVETVPTPEEISFLNHYF